MPFALNGFFSSEPFSVKEICLKEGWSVGHWMEEQWGIIVFISFFSCSNSNERCSLSHIPIHSVSYSLRPAFYMSLSWAWLALIG